MRQHLCNILKKAFMNKDNEKFPKQDAPEKNTDHAFVQVEKDGRAMMPQKASTEKEEKHSSRKENGTNDKR